MLSSLFMWKNGPYDKKDDFRGGESASEKIKFFREKALLFRELWHNTVYGLDEII